MIGERKEERRAFTKEERMQILKNTGGICACCGKKLTETNMTVEHIIPLSRGGTNDMENLTALCELHNKLKDNLLYMPFGFYAAIRNKPSFFKMEEHVRNWFKSIADEFDLERFPLISPQFILLSRSRKFCPNIMGFLGNGRSRTKKLGKNMVSITANQSK